MWVYALCDGNIHKVWKSTNPALGFIQCQRYDASQSPYNGYIIFWLQYFSTGTFAAGRDWGAPAGLTKTWFSNVMPLSHLACRSLRHQVPLEDMCYPYQRGCLLWDGGLSAHTFCLAQGAKHTDLSGWRPKAALGELLSNFSTHCLCFPCLSVYKVLVKNTTFSICAISCFCTRTFFASSFSSFLGGKKP